MDRAGSILYFNIIVIICNRAQMIASSSRKEFELARDEQDPMLVLKMIITSREAMQ